MKDLTLPPGARVAEIVDAYSRALQAGEAPDRDALLAQHPDLAVELAAALDSLDFVHRATRDLSAGDRGRDDVDAGAERELGDYRLLREVGRGGMAVVYEAEQVSLGRRVALKVLPFAAVLDPKRLQRFKNEALAAAHLRHPNIVPVFAVGCERGVHYYAMQYIEGQSLALAIGDMKRGGAGEGPRTPISSHESNREAAYIRMAAALGVQAAEALDHAHELGIVHRDVKPGNLLVDQTGALWITDFGLARSLHDVGLTITGELVGTVRYMSPEQALAKRAPMDHRTDVYSLGVTLYELFTLEPAFPGDDPHRVIQDIAIREPELPRRLNPALSRDLETVLLKAMAKDPAARYATAQEMADDLERCLADQPILARRPSLAARAARWTRRHRGLVGAALAILFVGIAALAVGAKREERNTRAALDRAETNLQLARNAVDKFLVETGMAELEDETRPALASSGLLEEALKFYEAYPEDRNSLSRQRQLLHALHRYEEALAISDRFLSTHPRDAGGLLERGHMLWHLGRGEEALGALEQAATIDPRLAKTPLIRGHALASLGRQEEALAAYREAIQLNPGDTGAHYCLGNAFLDRGDLESAMQEFTEAIRLKPDFAAAHNDLGTTLVSKGRIDDGIASYRRAIRLRPDNGGTHRNLGDALKQKANLDAAIDEYLEAVRLDPESAIAHNRLGSALLDKGDLEGGIAELRKAIEFDPDYALAHNNLGGALSRKGDGSGAILEHLTAIRLDPGNPDAHFNLGIAYQAVGQLDDAIASYREAIHLNPKYAQAHNNLGVMLLRKLGPDAAIAEYREALRLKPDLFETLNNLGQLLSEKGDRNGAITAFRQAIRLEPEEAELHLDLGCVLWANGERDLCLYELHEAIRLKPDLPEAHFNLGTVLAEENDLDEAIASYHEAIRLKPDFAVAHNNLGQALHASGELEEAAQEWQEAIRLDPQNPEVHNNLGSMYLQEGDPDSAMDEFHEAIRLNAEFAEAHCNLGHALTRQGRFIEALASLRTGHELGSRRPDWKDPSLQWVESARRRVELDGRLDRVLSGEERPRDVTERAEFADLLFAKTRYAEATRMWSEVFAEAPALAEDLATGHRYQAGCCAALAAARAEADAPALRGRALEWLRADLAARDRAMPGLVLELEHWKVDSDLAAVRDHLDDLPPDERESWSTLWADVDALLTRARVSK